MIGAEKYGERPPLRTTWAETKDSGHEIGKLMTSDFDQIIQQQNAEHSEWENRCRQCGKDCHPE